MDKMEIIYIYMHIFCIIMKDTKIFKISEISSRFPGLEKS